MEKNRLTISVELDESFKKLAEALPVMQVEVAGNRITIKGKPLYVDHHAEILCHYKEVGKKAVQNYVADVAIKQAQATVKLIVVK